MQFKPTIRMPTRFDIMLPLRITQGLLSFVVLALSGYVVNWYNVDTLTTSPTQINFLLFSALYSLLSVFYLEGVPKFLPRLVHPFVALAFEVTNVLFWFAGFIALAVFLNGLLFCRGTVCAAAQADTAFAAFLWIVWGVSVGLMIKDLRKQGFRKPAPAGSMQMKENIGS